MGPMDLVVPVSVLGSVSLVGPVGQDFKHEKSHLCSAMYLHLFKCIYANVIAFIRMYLYLCKYISMVADLLPK